MCSRWDERRPFFLVILVGSGLCHFCRFCRAVRVVEGNNHLMCYSCHMQVPSLLILLSPLSLEFRSFACHLKGEKLGQFIQVILNLEKILFGIRLQITW